MIENRYNYYTEQDNQILCLNGVTGIMLALTKEEFTFLKELMSKEELQKQHSKLTNKLVRSHFLISDMDEEIAYLKEKNRLVNNNGTWHLIINPTQDCNFRCWYCYEKHPKGWMQPETIRRIKLLADKIFSDKDTKHFVLSWFGGEPLLYFHEVAYEISNYIKKKAEECNVSFSNSMTTNGFLFTPDIISKCKDIKLTDFQITLDGDKEAHNKIRHQKGTPSFDRILQNSIDLAKSNPEVRIQLRINYNTKSIQHDFSQILDCIPLELRPQFRIQFQRIWQTYEKEGSDDTVKEILNENFSKLKKNHFNLSYNTNYSIFKGILCYADRKNYAHINYDGKIYRCTAQNYTPENELGYIDEEGTIAWDRRKTADINRKAFFDNALCLKCKYLAICGGPCFSRWQNSFRQGQTKECPILNIKADMTLDTFIKEYYASYSKRYNLNTV